MTPSLTTSAPDFVDASTLSHLARCQGPCITVLLPASHPGAQESERHAVLESLFHGLTAPDADGLRGRIEKELLAKHINGGGPGVALVAGSGFLEIYQASLQKAQIEQGDVPFILPLLSEALAPQDFLILSLSEKQMSVIHYLQGEATMLGMPTDAPESLEAFRHREARGEQNIEARASAGSTPGTMGALRFGTDLEREDSHAHRERYFARVDESLSPVLGKRLLLLLGVEEEVATFRRVAKHCQLFSGQLGHPAGRDLPLRDIAQQARECALAHLKMAGRKELGEIREKSDRRLALEGNEEVLDAAHAGRVHVLCVPQQADASRAEQELWNAAAVATLNHGGRLLVVNDTSVLAASLRY